MMKKIEEIEFEVSSKASQLKRFLQKPQAERMPFQIIQVAQILKKINTFQRFFDTKNESHAFSMLPSWTTLKCFEEGHTIYDKVKQITKQGCKPTEIYVLLEGKATIINNSVEYSFNPGMTFGEVEVLYQEPVRSSKAVCSSAGGCSCLVIERQALLPTLNKDVSITEAYNFFARQSYFQDLTQFDRKMLASRTERIKYDKGEYIAKENTIKERVFWIVRGSVAVVRTINVIAQKVLTPTVFRIDTLEESDTVGEYYCLHREVLDASFYFENIGSCYAINLYEVLKICPSLESLFQRHARRYPSDAEVLEIFQVEAERQALKKLSLLNVHDTPEARSKYLQSKHELSLGNRLRLPRNKASS